MDDDTVLLTSYFNLANGRRQDTADTFRVDASLPSKTAPDGSAALYIVTESSTGGHMGPRARRLCADTIAWEYSSHSDDPPAPRLKAALRTAHDDIVREFDGHVAVGVSVIAVEDDDVFLAQAAPSQVYVLHEGSLHSIAASVAGSSPFAHALGANAGPQISIFRDKVGPGDVLALCSSWFNRSADPDDLRDCFGAGTADDIAESLLDLGKQHDLRDATVVVIEAAKQSEIDASRRDGESPGFMHQVDDAVQALVGIGRLLMTELRPAPGNRERSAKGSLPDTHTSAPAGTATLEPESAYREDVGGREEWTVELPRVEPGGRTPGKGGTWNPDATAVYDVDDLRDAQHRASTGGARHHATEEVPAVSDEDEQWHGPGDVDHETWSKGGDQTGNSSAQLLDKEWESPHGGMGPKGDRAQIDAAGAVPREDSGYPRDPDFPGTQAEPQSELEEVNSRLQHDFDMGDVIPPVQAFPDTSTEPSRIYATSRDIQAVNRRPRRFGGIARPAADPNSGSHVIRPGLSDVDLRQPVSRPAPPAVVWVSVGVICLFAVAALYLFITHRHTAVATNPYPARVAADIRKAQAAGTPALQDAYLAKANADIQRAQQRGTRPARIAILRTQVQTTSDSLHHITHVTAPVVLNNFGASAGAQIAQIATGPDTIYALDTGRKAVYSVPPNPSSSPTQVVQSGEQDTGLTFGTPTQITTSGNIALVLDDKNVLVRFNSGTKTAITLPQQSTAQKIVSMVNFGPDVYLLDVAGSQVWRYPDAVAGFNPTPSGFFPPNTPDIGQASSFTMDDKSMFVLKADGSVIKFDTQQASQQKFTARPRTPFKGPVAIFTDVGLRYLWVADPGNNRIVQLDKATGAYVRAYVSASSMDLSHLKSIAVPPTGKVLYVLAGNVLYDFPVQP